MKIFSGYSTCFDCDIVFFDVSFHYKAVMQLSLFASLVFHLVGNPGEVAAEDGMVLEAVDNQCRDMALEEAGSYCHGKASEEMEDNYCHGKVLEEGEDNYYRDMVLVGGSQVH